MPRNNDGPEILDAHTYYEGKQISVSMDTIREQGRIHHREIVIHPGSAAIVPILDQETVVLVRQYRHPTRKYLLEIPAGCLNPDERPEQAALRELQEEVGLSGQMEKLSEFFVSPGFLQEKMWLYLATDLTETHQRLEEDELIEIVRLPIDRALQMISDGEIEDAKTIIGLLLAAPRLGAATLGPLYPAV